jgi:hypothetical protein
MIRKAQIILKPCAITSSSAKKMFQMHIASRKIMLLYSLLILLPMFPLIYFLTFFGIFDTNIRDASLMIAGEKIRIKTFIIMVIIIIITIMMMIIIIIIIIVITIIIAITIAKLLPMHYSIKIVIEMKIELVKVVYKA